MWFRPTEGGNEHKSSPVRLALRLTAFGRGTGLVPVVATPPEIAAKSVRYVHGKLTEWWRVLPVGFEQGFTLTERPAGKGRLRLVLGTNQAAKTRGDSLAWGRIHYGGLVVTDADGSVVPATLNAAGDRVLITVNDSHAVYPLTVDPLIWLQQRVAASDGGQYDSFGSSFALFGDTALIGAPYAGVSEQGGGTNPLQGAAYVFSDKSGSWKQVQKLTASDGAAGDNFGDSVALDGTTAIIGAYDATVGSNPYQGAAYVFTESSDGTWTQSQKLVASNGSSFASFGLAVALDGTTAIIGADNQDIGSPTYQGAAYVFTYANGTWTQAQELLASDGTNNFADSLALSGSTVLIGASNATVGGNPDQGKVYVFTNSGGTWAQTQILTANDGGALEWFGNALAVDGDTALIGDSGATIGGNNYQGAAYVFTNSSGSWIQTQKLIADDGEALDGFGTSVTLGGGTALIGAPEAAIGANGYQGAAYMFTASGGTWVQSAKFTASDGKSGDGFGDWVALDGATALIGAYGATVGANNGQGAAYFFDQSDLGLAVSAPAVINPGNEFTSQTIATNSASVTSPGVSVVTSVPPEVSLVAAAATQGDCSADAGLVTCNFGPIAGNAGTATANITFKVIHIAPATVEDSASVVGTTPPLTASAATKIVGTPVAKDGVLSTDENASASGTLQATSPSGAPLTFSIVAWPANGNVALTDPTSGRYTYTPNPGYSGGDLFAFKANDGIADSNVAIVRITVKASQKSGGGASTPLGLGLLAAFGLIAALRRRRRHSR